MSDTPDEPEGGSASPTPAVGTSDLAIRLAEIEANLKHKPGVWGIFGTMLAAIALPIGTIMIWFPSEISRLTEEIKTAASFSQNAAESAAIAADNSTNVKDRLDRLVGAMAKATAQKNSPELLISLKNMLPPDVFGSLSESGLLVRAGYSDFDGQDWMFVESRDLLNLTTEIKDKLEIALEHEKWNFVIE